MKKIVSSGIFAVVAILLFVSSVTVIATAASDQTLNDEEIAFFNAWISSPDNRNAVELEYWKYVEKQAKTADKTLPAALNPILTWVEVEYVFKHVTYVFTYKGSSFSQEELNTHKSMMIKDLCNNASILLYLTTFGGTITYAYIEDSNVEDKEVSVIVTGIDCVFTSI